MEIFSLIAGVLVGIVGGVVFYLFYKSKTVAKNDFENIIVFILNPDSYRPGSG